MIATTLKCLLFKMPPTELLVSHCKKEQLLQLLPNPFHIQRLLLSHSAHAFAVYRPRQPGKFRKWEEKGNPGYSFPWHFPVSLSHRFWSWRYIGLSGFYLIQHWVLWIGIYSRKGIDQLALGKECKTECCGWSLLSPTPSTEEKYLCWKRA